MVGKLKSDFLGSLRVRLNPAHAMEQEVLTNGVWESHVAYLISVLVDPGATCIDVGANIGLHSLAMALRAGPSGRVHAYEPSPQYFERLKENVSLNPSIENIICHNFGVSDQPGFLKVFRSGDGSNSYLAPEQNPNYWTADISETVETCEVVKIDDSLKDETIDFMKVDVEGMELEVLSGSAKAIAKCRPNIIFETLLSDFDCNKIQSTEELLRNLGYDLFAFDPENNLLIRTAFPHLSNDTVAIHFSKLSRYSQMMIPFWEFESSLTRNQSGEQIEVILVDNPANLIFARFIQAGKTNLLSAKARFSNDGLIVETEKAIANWSFRLQFPDRNRNDFLGEISIGSNNWRIEGRKLRECGLSL